MANETQIGQLVIDLKIKTEALEKGLETAQKKLRSIEEENKQLENSNKSLDASFLAMSATAVASLVAIKSAIDDGVNKYNEYTNNMAALQKTAKSTNNSMSDVKDTIEDVNKLKLMDDSDVTAATKNLLTYGFTVKQTGEILKVLQDAAVGNRQASYSLSEAVRVTTEGIRMENSVLSDAAGVQKNISKMYEEYAHKIGKTADTLTQAEKAQAVYNGIMDEAAIFTGSAIEMADGFQGVQAQSNASSLELSRTLGETMIPVLTQINSMTLAVTQTLNSFVEGNKGATAGTIAFVTALGTTALGITAVTKVMQSCKMAIDTLNVSTKALKATMASAFVVSAIVGSIVAITTAIKENEEAQAKLNEITETYKQIQEGAYEYTDNNIANMEQRKSDIEKQIELYQKWSDAQKQYDELPDEQKGSYWTEMAQTLKKNEDGTISLTKSAYELKKEIKSAKKEFKDFQETTGNYGDSLDDLNQKLKNTTKYLEESDAVKKISKGLDTETVKKKQQEAAQLKVNVQTMQEYLNVVKKGDTTTTQYQEAVKQLAKAYPEVANAEGIIVDKAQDLINAEALKADTAWQGSQNTINSYIAVLNAALNSEAVQKQVAQNIGISIDDLNVKLQSTLALYNAMANMAPAEVAGVTPVSVSAPKVAKSSGSRWF